eukprot:5955117-Prymnesium_polylepis.1
MFSTIECLRRRPRDGGGERQAKGGKRRNWAVSAGGRALWGEKQQSCWQILLAGPGRGGRGDRVGRDVQARVGRARRTGTCAPGYRRSQSLTRRGSWWRVRRRSPHAWTHLCRSRTRPPGW